MDPNILYYVIFTAFQGLLDIHKQRHAEPATMNTRLPARSPARSPNFDCVALIKRTLPPARNTPQNQADLMVPVHNPGHLTPLEKKKLLRNCKQHNLSFYRFEKSCRRAALFDFWKQLGLTELVYNPESDDDGISQIKVNPQSRYIPYTNKPLQWHTDGYYSLGKKTIRAFAMHCIHPASSGGQNTYLNPEVLIARLLKENPDYITALMHPQAMTVLPNTDDEKSHRAASTTPMLTVEENHLLLRYSERTHSIAWNKDPLLTQARARIKQILREDSPEHIACRLNANEGVVCNNVLHCRSGFQQAKQATPRLLYRARFNNYIQ